MFQLGSRHITLICWPAETVLKKHRDVQNKRFNCQNKKDEKEK